MVNLPFLKKKKEEEEDLDIPDQLPDLNMNIQQPSQTNFNQPNQLQNFNQSFQPMPQQQQELQYQQYSSNVYASWEEYIQSIVESVVSEKFKEVERRIEDINMWKEKIEGEINTIKEFVENVNQRIDDIASKTIEKIREYDSTMKETSAEIKALHRVMQTMIPAIAESVRELKGVIEELKKLREKP